MKVNGADSESTAVLSGILQGSVLGPLLFVIYINDLHEAVTCDALLFADDTKLYRQITSRKDAHILQCDLRNWSEKWLLKFNLDKCHVFVLGKFENTMYTHRYNMYGNEHVFEEKDLGVTIDSELRFEEHISEKVKKSEYNSWSDSTKFLVSRLSTIQKAVHNICKTTSGILTCCLSTTSF